MGHRVTSTSLSSGGSVTITYNGAGNVLRKSDFSANSGNAYSYGAGGCGPHAVSSVVLPGGSTATYTCDANGNVVGGSAMTAVFDAENRPRSITRSSAGSGGGGGAVDLIFKSGFQNGSRPAGGSAVTTLPDGSMSYAYDAKGGRYVEIAASATTRYGPNGYEKVGGGVTTHRHELGPVIVSRVGSTDSVSYVLRDRLGSTIAISDAAVVVGERRQFDAFGKARNADFTDRPAGQANLTKTNRGFTGHTQADDVWLVHMNGRVYDQNLGRFLSVDPIVPDSGSQSLNPYSYIQNNPLSGTDPSGYESPTNECAGGTATGCANQQEVKATQAATMTGSHIKGGGSGGSSFSYIEVNPSAAGTAELSVALAGSSSGYVVQASSIEKAASSVSVAADQGKVGSQGNRPQDRVGKGEEGDVRTSGSRTTTQKTITGKLNAQQKADFETLIGSVISEVVAQIEQRFDDEAAAGPSLTPLAINLMQARYALAGAVVTFQLDTTPKNRDAMILRAAFAKGTVTSSTLQVFRGAFETFKFSSERSPPYNLTLPRGREGMVGMVTHESGHGVLSRNVDASGDPLSNKEQLADAWVGIVWPGRKF